MLRKTEGQEMYVLDFRIARQSLPAGSSPLMAFGGKTICGEYFSPEEVDAFITSIGWSRDDVVVFERAVERGEATIHEATQATLGWKPTGLNKLAAIERGEYEDDEE